VSYTFTDWETGKKPPKGWDAADARDDGWTKQNIDDWLRATVKPWSPGGAPDPVPTPPADPVPPPLDPQDPGPSAPDAAIRPIRPFEALMEAVKTLTEDDVDGIEEVLADAVMLSSVRQDAILRAVKAATGLGMVALKKQMREVQGDGEDSKADHLELARRAVQNIGSENIICAGPFIWMWSDTGVWQRQEERMVKQQVQRTIEGIGLPVNSTLVNGVSEVLKTEIFIPQHRFNLGHVETINCLNGQIVPDGDGWRIEAHQRDSFRTTQVPIAYDPQATAPRFTAYLQEVFRDDTDKAEKIAALLEMMGYTLMSHARHEMFIMLIGSGANGKSVLLSVLEALCGTDNVAGVQPSNFDRSFQRAHLDQKLANIVTEIKQGETIADAELKGIVSGEKSTVEHKFQDPFDMHPFSTCWFGTNHMPHTRDFSEALFRRALIVPFNRKFGHNEKDPNIKDDLIAELPGILNMALAAYRRACRVGFTQPASSEEAKHEWRLEADQVAMFVEDCCARVTGATESASVLFAEYQTWASAQGIGKTMSLKGLRDRLTRLGFGSERRRDGRYVTGIRIGAQQSDENAQGW